jgi:IPT/TIG domain
MQRTRLSVRAGAVAVVAAWVAYLGTVPAPLVAHAAAGNHRVVQRAGVSTPPRHRPSIASRSKRADLAGRPVETRSPRNAPLVASGTSHVDLSHIDEGGTGVSQVEAVQGVSHDAQPSPVSPPDTTMSASATVVVEIVNLSLLTMGHDGGSQQVVQLGDLWQPAIVAKGAQDAQLSDPHIVYDAESQRWFTSIVFYESALLGRSTAPGAHSWIGLAASTDATPTTWNLYAVESAPGVLMDQPGLGVNSDKITTGANDFDCTQADSCGGGWIGAELAVASKAEMIAGSNPLDVDGTSDSTAFGYAPAVSLSPTTTEYVPMNFQPFDRGTGRVTGPQAVKVTSITGVPGVGGGAGFAAQSITICPACGNASVTGAPLPVPQPETQTTVDAGDDRFLSAVWKNNMLWTGGDTAVTTGPEAAMSLFEVDTSTMTLPVATVVDSGTGESLVYPNIALDQNGDVVVAFSRGSGSRFMSSSAGVYLPGSNSFRSAGVLDGGAGQGPYDCTCNGQTTRFGDYSGSVVDPADPSTVWVASEYSAVGDGNGNNWGTLLSRVTLDAPAASSSSPSGGPTGGGTWVTVNGSHLDQNTAVLFGGVPAQAVRWNGANQVAALSPPHRPGTYDVVLRTPTGSVTLPGAFTFALPAVRRGYWMDASDGGIFSEGSASFHGSMGATRLNQPVVGMAARPQADSYWMVASDGGVFAFPPAPFAGSMGGTPLNQPVVGMAATPSGNGYWLVARDGGIFSFGDAGFYGSTGKIRLNQPIVGMAPTPTGRGYWLVASDGGVFSFGDAVFWGSTGDRRLNRPVVGMVPLSDGLGYWLVASDGGIFSFGDAVFRGSTGAMHLNAPVVGMAQSGDDGGYWLVATDGGIFSFGSAAFHGSMGGTRLNQPVVGMAPGP